jgi:hypothetical protein
VSAAVGAWTVTNYRGRPVSLLGGPAVVLLALVGAPSPAAAVAGLGALAAGRYDDVAGSRAEQRTDKGFAGHLRALRAGRVSSGAVKVMGIGAAALVARALDRGRVSTSGGGVPALVAVLRDGALIAASANLVNLLDLRPGRALKAVTLLGAAGALAAGPDDRRGFAAPALAAMAALPADVRERTMLGDAGANGLGSLLGVAAVRSTSATTRTVLLIGVLGLTAASERVSFSAVIDRTRVLAALDRLGRV